MGGDALVYSRKNVGVLGMNDSEDAVLLEYSKFPWLVFKVDETKYAVNSKAITGILPLPQTVTSIPTSPKYIKGIIRARGEVITLIELRTLFLIQPSNNQYEQMVVSLQDNELHIGIIVDSVIGVENINYLYKHNDIQNLCTGDYIIGVGNTEKDDDLILLVSDNKLTNKVREAEIDISEDQIV